MELSAASQLATRGKKETYHSGSVNKESSRKRTGQRGQGDVRTRGCYKGRGARHIVWVQTELMIAGHSCVLTRAFLHSLTGLSCSFINSICQYIDVNLSCIPLLFVLEKREMRRDVTLSS